MLHSHNCSTYSGFSLLINGKERSIKELTDIPCIIYAGTIRWCISEGLEIWGRGISFASV